MQEFCDYFTNTWIEGAHFPIEMWNHHRASTRTTNAVEGWHSRINKKTNCHPNIYDALELIRKEQEHAEITML